MPPTQALALVMVIPKIPPIKILIKNCNPAIVGNCQKSLNRNLTEAVQLHNPKLSWILKLKSKKEKKMIILMIVRKNMLSSIKKKLAML